MIYKAYLVLATSSRHAHRAQRRGLCGTVEAESYDDAAQVVRRRWAVLFPGKKILIYDESGVLVGTVTYQLRDA